MTDVLSRLGVYLDAEDKRELIAFTGDFVHVVSLSLGKLYDWHELEAWWSPSRGRYFWVSGSGCSCNDLGGEVNSSADFQSGRREDLMAAIRREANGEYLDPGQFDHVLSSLGRVGEFVETRS